VAGAGDLDAQREAARVEAERHLRRGHLHHVEDARVRKLERREQRRSVAWREARERGIEQDRVVAEQLRQLRRELVAERDDALEA